MSTVTVILIMVGVGVSGVGAILAWVSYRKLVRMESRLDAFMRAMMGVKTANYRADQRQEERHKRHLWIVPAFLIPGLALVKTHWGGLAVGMGTVTVAAAGITLWAIPSGNPPSTDQGAASIGPTAGETMSGSGLTTSSVSTSTSAPTGPPLLPSPTPTQLQPHLQPRSVQPEATEVNPLPLVSTTPTTMSTTALPSHSSEPAEVTTSAGEPECLIKVHVIFLDVCA